MREELLDPDPDPEESADEGVAETTLRPRRLADFVGQAELKEHLEIVLEAARRRGHPPDHLLFSGPPGLGKTTLAGLCSTQLRAPPPTASRPAGRRGGRPARWIRLDLPRFTLVGATTRTGSITGPLRDRFGLVARLDYYTAADLESIVERAAGILDVTIDGAGCAEIARRSRGTPRIANRLLRRVRDFAEVRGDGTVDRATAEEGLALFGVDGRGLDKVDRALLHALCHRFGGGPVGLSTLAISVGEQTETVEDVYEPFLIQQGLLMRTPRGRVALPAAWEHLGLAPPPDAAAGGATPTLFGG